MLQTVTWEMSKRHVWGVMSRGLILKSVIIIMKHIAAVSVLVRGWEDERPKAQELDSEQRRHKRLCRRKTTGINAGKVPSWLIWKLWWDSFFCYPQPRRGDTRPHLSSIYRLSICLSLSLWACVAPPGLDYAWSFIPHLTSLRSVGPKDKSPTQSLRSFVFRWGF